MENDIAMRGRGLRRAAGAVGPKRFEVRVNAGPLLQRAALGDIHNRPAVLQAKIGDKKTHDNLQKIIPVAPLPLQRKFLNTIPAKVVKQSNKENEIEIPLHLPTHQKLSEDKVEKMEIEEEECAEIEQLAVAFSTQILDVPDIDAEDKNPQLVSDYVKDIYRYLWEREVVCPVKEKYLEGQKITSRMRAILIDWIVQVHQRFTLLQETLYLTVALIDRYLQANKLITKDKLQLVGVTALYVASKYEEMYIPEIADFAYITDKTFTKRDIRLMEIHMLTTLKFYISYPLPLHFLRRNSKAAKVDSGHHTIAKYLMELTITEYSFCHYRSSLIAGAALYLSLKIVDDGTKWDEVVAYYSNYKEEELLPVVYKLAYLVVKSATSKQQAVKNKYKSSKFMKISEISLLKPTSEPLKSLAEKAK